MIAKMKRRNVNISNDLEFQFFERGKNYIEAA